MDLQCNCEKQEYQDFSFPKIVVICNTSMISVNVRVLLKRHFQARIEHSYSPFGIWLLNSLDFIPIFTKLKKILSRAKWTIKFLIMHNASDFICVYSRRKCTRHVFIKSKNCQMKILKPTNDKLINLISCNYARRAIYLVPLINSKCQWGCWPHKLFAHRLHCTLVYPIH